MRPVFITERYLSSVQPVHENVERGGFQIVDDHFAFFAFLPTLLQRLAEVFGVVHEQSLVNPVCNMLGSDFDDDRVVLPSECTIVLSVAECFFNFGTRLTASNMPFNGLFYSAVIDQMVRT